MPIAISLDLLTKPEKAVYNALIKLGIHFEVQHPFFGGQQFRGGIVADFFIAALNLVLAVQSEFWHYGNPSRIAQDLMQRTALEGIGIRLIFIDETDALKAPDYYVREAIQGVDHSRMRDL